VDSGGLALYVEPITLAIPFYKGLRYLRLAIESVLKQGDPNWLLLVCDDGPEVGVRELVEGFGDARISYSKNVQNLGMAENWNRCLELAQTSWVSLLHGDDELLPNYVATIQNARSKHPDAAALFTETTIIDVDSKPTFSFVDYVKKFLKPKAVEVILEGAGGLESLMHGNFIMCPTVCYNKQLLRVPLFSNRWKMVLDLHCYWQILERGFKIVGIPVVAYAYRRHDENATTAYTASLLRFEEEVAIHNEIALHRHAKGWRAVSRVALNKRMILLHILFRLVLDGLGLRFKAAGTKIRFLLKVLKENRKILSNMRLA